MRDSACGSTSASKSGPLIHTPSWRFPNSSSLADCEGDSARASERRDRGRDGEHGDVVAHDAMEGPDRIQRTRELGDRSPVAERGEGYCPFDGILLHRAKGRGADLVVRQTDAALRELRPDAGRVPRLRAERSFAPIALSAREIRQIHARRDVVKREGFTADDEAHARALSNAQASPGCQVLHDVRDHSPFRGLRCGRCAWERSPDLGGHDAPSPSDLPDRRLAASASPPHHHPPGSGSSSARGR
jgi:hypothetical protein